MIRYASNRDAEKIKSLWNTAFPEDMAFNKYFFENIFKAEYTLIYEKDNRLIAMLQQLPYYIAEIGEIAYIYGVATAPEYRRQGYMSELLDYSYSQLIKKGIASMLIPATPQLFEYYKKAGYTTAFFTDKKEFSKTHISNLKPTEIDLIKINEIYESALKNIPHPVRNTQYWQTQLLMLKGLGGGILYFEDMGYCCYWLGEKPEIQEIFVTKPQYEQEICNFFCNEFNVNSVKYTTFGSTPFGMLKGADIKGYMNMMYN